MTVVSEKQRRGYLIVCKTRHYILPMSWQLPGPFLNSPVFARRDLQIVRQTEEENFWEVFTEGIFLNNRWAPWSNWQYSWPNGSIPKGGGARTNDGKKLSTRYWSMWKLVWTIARHRLAQDVILAVSVSKMRLLGPWQMKRLCAQLKN